MTADPTMQTEPGDIVEDLRHFGYAPGGYMCRCGRCSAEFIGDKRAGTCRECALALDRDRLRTEHKTAMSEMAKLLVENERLRRELEQARERSSSNMLSAAAVQAIREMLAGFGVPKAAFIDDHVVNGLAWARMQGLEEAAVIVEQADGAIQNRQELAATLRSLANTGKEDRG